MSTILNNRFDEQIRKCTPLDQSHWRIIFKDKVNKMFEPLKHFNFEEVPMRANFSIITYNIACINYLIHIFGIKRMFVMAQTNDVIRLLCTAIRKAYEFRVVLPDKIKIAIENEDKFNMMSLYKSLNYETDTLINNIEKAFPRLKSLEYPQNHNPTKVTEFEGNCLKTIIMTLTSEFPNLCYLLNGELAVKGEPEVKSETNRTDVFIISDIKLPKSTTVENADVKSVTESKNVVKSTPLRRSKRIASKNK